MAIMQPGMLTKVHDVLRLERRDTVATLELKLLLHQTFVEQILVKMQKINSLRNKNICLWYRPDNLGLPLCVDLKLVEGGLKLRCFCVKMARSRRWLKVGLHYLVLLKWRRRQWR